LIVLKVYSKQAEVLVHHQHAVTFLVNITQYNS